MSETVEQLLKRSGHAKPVGKGVRDYDGHSVYAIDDPRFSNYLIRTSQPITGQTINDLFLQPNDFSGRNFGQPIFQNAQSKLSLVLNAGTCINKTYAMRRDEYIAAGMLPHEAREEAVHSVMDQVIKMPDEAFSKMIDDIKFLASIGRSPDAVGTNLTFSKDRTNYIDTEIIQPKYFDVNNVGIDLPLKVLSRFDRSESKIYSTDEYKERSNLISEKLIKANGGKTKIECDQPVPEITTQLTQVTEIKPAMSAEALLKALQNAEKAYKLQTLF